MSIERRTTRSGTVYDVRFRGPDGKQFKRTFSTKREAQQFESSQRVDLRRGIWIDPAGRNVLIETWAWTWLDNDVAKTPGSRATDAGILRSAILPVLGHRPLGGLTPVEIQNLVVGWARLLKPRTVRRRYAVISAMFSAAVNADLIARSPCRGIRLPPMRPARVRILTPDELGALLDELPQRYRLLVHLAAILGLRFSECAGLRVGCVDFDAHLIRIEESLGEANGRIFSKTPKTAAGRRVLPMPRDLEIALWDHLRRGRTTGHSDSFVFQGPKGAPLRRNNFRTRVWVPACRRAHVEGLGFHDLRRTTATALIAAGTSVRDVQDLLGHTDPRMTLAIYAQATAEGKRGAIEKLSAAFNRPAGEPSRTVANVSGCAMDAPWSEGGQSSADYGSLDLAGETAGGGAGNRTPGLNSAIVALYQLSYTPAGSRSR
jgi:integrase